MDMTVALGEAAEDDIALLLRLLLLNCQIDIDSLSAAPPLASEFRGCDEILKNVSYR